MNNEFYTERNAMERDLSNSYRIREKELTKAHHIYADQPKTPREAIAWLNAGYYDKLDDKEMDREYDTEYGSHPVHIFSFRKTPADYDGYNKARTKLKAEYDATTLKIKVLPPTEALTHVEKFRPTVH